MLGSLMILTALLDLSTACPLILEPAELVQELGEDILVNCTTTFDGHRGMYWTYGDEKEDEDTDSFIALQILNVDWNTKAKCTIKLNDTHECSKDLDVKVYKKPTSITVQSDGPAVKGNQLELRCEVYDVAVVQNLNVTWYKKNTRMKTENHYLSANSTANVTSFVKWNVSREEDGATFTCEALEFGPRGLLFVSNESWKLSVQYAPEFEENKNYTLDDVHFVNSTDEVRLHCEAVANPPPDYSWIKDGVTVANNTNNLLVIGSHLNENTTFNCIANNHLGSVLKKFIVIVMENSSTPKENAVPSVSNTSDLSTACPLILEPAELVQELGADILVNCTTTFDGHRGMYWTYGDEKQDEVTDSLIALQIWHVDWNTKAKCTIKLSDTHECSKDLDVKVYKSPDKVQVSTNSSGSMLEGKVYQLKCDVFNVAPHTKLQVSWYQDQKLLETKRERLEESKETPINVTSILELTFEKEHDGANFTCEAELLLEQEHNPKMVSESYTASVQYKPYVSCPEYYADREDDLLLYEVPCKAQGNPAPALSWYFKNKLVNSTEPLMRGDSGTYTAKFTNSIGVTSATVHITVEYGPSFSCKGHYNVTENDKIVSECQPEGEPKPESYWRKNGKEIDLTKMWKKEDSGQYSIVATNKHGEATYNLSINVLYISRFSDETITRELNLGENLTMECSVDGNPPPLLRWEKYPNATNINVNTRGRQIYVNVTEATSSNAGLYSCIATNEVGSVSKNVTLMMIKGETNTVKNTIFIIVALVVLLVILIGILIYCNNRKKSGYYTVIGLSDSVPLTTRPSVI